MEQENTVLCGANSYEEKYFFNEQFAALPATIKDELKIMCVLFVNQVGGILLLEFAPDGTLVFRVSSHEDDFFFDEQPANQGTAERQGRASGFSGNVLPRILFK